MDDALTTFKERDKVVGLDEWQQLEKQYHGAKRKILIRNTPSVYFIPNCAVEMDTRLRIEGRAWRSEGTEANNLNAFYGAWPWAGNFSGVQ